MGKKILICLQLLFLPLKETWEESLCSGCSATMERNQQSGHSHSFPVMENVSPDTENGVRGQSAKATERVRSLMLWIRICFLPATPALQLGQRKQVSSPPSAEGGNERPTPIPASGTLGPWKPQRPGLDPADA